MTDINKIADKLIEIFNKNDIYDYQKLKYILSPLWYDFAGYSVYNPFEKAYGNYVGYILGLDKYERLISNSNFAPYWCYNADCIFCNKKHTYLDKKVILFNNPIWSKIYPPNDWDCGCSVYCYTSNQILERKLSLQEGNTIELSKLNPDYLTKLDIAQWQILYKKYLIKHLISLKEDIESEEE